MNYPSEFMKKRSFEVVWAVFRVAAVIPRLGIKQILEDRALAYFSQKNIDTLDALEEVIQLGSKLGDITEINSSVLLREIGTLRTIFTEAKDIVQNPAKPSQESIEYIFSEPPMLFSDFVQTMHPRDTVDSEASPAGVVNTEVSPANDIAESGNSNLENAKNNGSFSHIYKSSSFSGKSPANDIAESGNDKSGNNPAIKATQISGNADSTKSVKTAQNTQPVLSSAERKERIVSILKSKSFCNINDIMERLPKVSDRTLRYDIKTLVDSKIVERVGNGGPNSFFRLRKKEQ